MARQPFGMVVTEQPGFQRTMRNPVHTFHLKTPPFALQPFMIAPVLPGETMKNLMLKARVVSDPIVNPLIGWWKEYYFFYVKHRDLYNRDDLINMVLDPAWDVSPVTTDLGTTADVGMYYGGGAGMIHWSKACFRRVVDCYFRDEGQTYADNTIAFAGDIGTRAIGSFVGNSWLDSAVQAAELTALDVDVDSADANTTVQASEVVTALRRYEQLLDSGLVQMSYEDYLRTYGIRPKPEELHIPELIRYSRSWTYPTNTIDPTNGTPRSAVSWSIAERADKDRQFREPGFIFGVTICRPKVYFSKQVGSIVEVMNDINSWLPALLRNDRNASFKLVADAVGPIGAISDDTGGWWVDIKDALLYGDQYLNFALTATDKNLVANPNAGVTPNGKRYVQALAGRLGSKVQVG